MLELLFEDKCKVKKVMTVLKSTCPDTAKFGQICVEKLSERMWREVLVIMLWMGFMKVRL